MSKPYTCYEWNRLRYDADRLWKQGIRSGDRTIIELMYGYSEHDATILCDQLAERERITDHYLEDYNPEIGF